MRHQIPQSHSSHKAALANSEYEQIPGSIGRSKPINKFVSHHSGLFLVPSAPYFRTGKNPPLEYHCSAALAPRFPNLPIGIQQTMTAAREQKQYTGRDMTKPADRGFIKFPRNGQSCPDCRTLEKVTPFQSIRVPRGHQTKSKQKLVTFESCALPPVMTPIVRFQNKARDNIPGVAMRDIIDGYGDIWQGDERLPRSPLLRNPTIQVNILLDGHPICTVPIHIGCVRDHGHDSELPGHARMTHAGLAYHICYSVSKILESPPDQNLLRHGTGSENNRNWDRLRCTYEGPELLCFFKGVRDSFAAPTLSM
ncbi:hypothetical protein C8J56DRAFT_1046884 [Mycena floridula]|nr:hypothetical protein C8J56DRAFT_1046884 [Mycena floridula]